MISYQASHLCLRAVAVSVTIVMKNLGHFLFQLSNGAVMLVTVSVGLVLL